jgi:DNA-binding NarL/FixJ family response regulator
MGMPTTSATTRCEPSVLLIPDPGVRAGEVAALLVAAGLDVSVRDDPLDGEVRVLLLAGDARARVKTIGEHAGRRSGAPLVATMPADATPGLLRRALRAGADGVVFDDDVDHNLVPTVRAVAVGQLCVPLVLRGQVAPRPLSYREKEILSYVVHGYTNSQIAAALYLAESTVKTHLSSAFEKLGARSRAEAAALVLDPDSGYALALPTVAAPSAA